MGIRNQEPPPGTMAINDIHTPVLLNRCVELLAPALDRAGAILVDATLGMGGHAEAFLQRFPGLVLVGLDRDLDALAIAEERLKPFRDRVHFVHTIYDGIQDALTGLGIAEVTGVLFDLGVSSLQLDRVERGFSYSKDAPLDMRMDNTSDLTAELILATYSEQELRQLTFQDLTHPDDLQANLEQLQLLLEGKISNYDLEKRLRCKDGHFIWTHVRTSLQRNSQDDSPEHLISVIDDITRERAERQALLARIEELERLLQGI